MKTTLQKITECRKRVEAEKSVCKWCRSHATQVTSRGHVVRYACGVSHDRQFNRWFILDTACDRFRMRNRIKQLEHEVKALRKRITKRGGVVSKDLIGAKQEQIPLSGFQQAWMEMSQQEVPPVAQEVLNRSFWDMVVDDRREDSK